MLRARFPAIVRQSAARRTLASSSRVMGEGDTGAPRGSVGDDAFSKRRAASEDKWIREEEQAKLKALSEKIKNAQKHMAELQKYIDDAAKESGGEKN